MTTNGKSRITAALAVGVGIFMVSVVCPRFFLDSLIPRLATTQGLELLLSLLAIGLLGKGNFSEYGFRLRIEKLTPSGGAVRWLLLGVLAIALGACATLAVLITGAKGNPLLKELSFPQIVLFVWIFSSTIEEIFTRGFIQSHLASVLDSSVHVPLFKVDRATFISALFFACMHLILLVSGADYKTVVILLLFTFSVGLLAGHLRARTGSLLPAIGAHLLANMGGAVGGVLYAIYAVLTGNKLPGM